MHLIHDNTKMLSCQTILAIKKTKFPTIINTGKYMDQN